MTHNFTPQNKTSPRLLIIGAGPAGLSAAYRAAENSQRCVVLEQGPEVGGLSRTQSYKGYRFDIGGHRFFSETSELNALWHKIMGKEFLDINRASRIYFNGRFFRYPLEFFDTLKKLGPVQGIRILFSFAWAKARPAAREKNFEQWVVNRFGRRLFHTFFKPYTEKVWGISCDRLSADWAAQRITGLSFTKALWHAVTGRGAAKTLINRFNYPAGGAGLMWQTLKDMIEDLGGQVRLNTRVNTLVHGNGRITAVGYENAQGLNRMPVDHLISSAPLTRLVSMLAPPAPEEIRDAADNLSYRAFIMVVLIVRTKTVFPDQWIYIHEPGVKVARIQNFKNWHAQMVPDACTTSLGMEYFCNEGDGLWNLSDREMINLAVRESSGLNFVTPCQVADGVVVRQPKAYPVYDEAYAESVAEILEFINGFENLETIGRNGCHRYNNMDDSMLSGMAAAQAMASNPHGQKLYKMPLPDHSPVPEEPLMKAVGQ